jgi:hypothetical protein
LSELAEVISSKHPLDKAAAPSRPIQTPEHRRTTFNPFLGRATRDNGWDSKVRAIKRGF